MDAYESKRIEILRQAALAFAEDGYHQTSVNGLAERLGVSKPVLYYYAKNKDDLLFQCGQVARKQLLDATEDVNSSGANAAEKLRRFFLAYAEIMCGDFGRCLVLFDDGALSPESRALDIAHRRQIEATVMKFIVDGQSDGSLGAGDPMLITRAMFGAFNMVPRWFNPAGKLKPADIGGAFLDIFARGLTAR